MEPRIQYAKTADGVSIAFWTLGAGWACRGGSGKEYRQILTPPNRGRRDIDFTVPEEIEMLRRTMARFITEEVIPRRLPKEERW